MQQSTYVEQISSQLYKELSMCQVLSGTFYMNDPIQPNSNSEIDIVLLPFYRGQQRV